MVPGVEKQQVQAVLEHQAEALRILDRITVEPDKRGGEPCIRGSGFTVCDILDYLASGMTESEILADFPDLESPDIRAALSFAAERERRLGSLPSR